MLRYCKRDIIILALTNSAKLLKNNLCKTYLILGNIQNRRWVKKKLKIKSSNMALKRKETMTKQNNCWVYKKHKQKKACRTTFLGKLIKQMTKRWMKKIRKMKHLNKRLKTNMAKKICRRFLFSKVEMNITSWKLKLLILKSKLPISIISG